MKTYLNILYTLLAVTLLATSCRKDDGNTIIREVDLGYDIVPYTISVGISPMTDIIDSITFKTTFAVGDVIEISNPKLLLEPATLTSDDYIGKTRATFSGELKVRVGETLQSGSSTLTAALRNTAVDTLYNCGKPFFNVKEVSSLKKELDVYSYWACKNYTYTSSNASINIMQNTVFAQFDIPVNGANMTMTCGRSRCIKSVNYNTILALPFGTQIENEFLNISQKLDADSKFVYTINADVAVPEGCVPGLFSVAEDKHVFFSKGNLQYRPFDGAWRLAQHQYDRCFKIEQSVGDNYSLWSGANDWTDLHGWGTWIEGGNPKNTSEEIVDYDMSVDANGNLIGTCALGSQWSILSCENWDYLLYERPNAREKHGVSKIADTKGLVLLPDYWTMPDGLPDFVPLHNEDNVINVYSIDEWSKMENAGAVFIPFVGYRSGSSVDCTAEEGLYWTINYEPYLFVIFYSAEGGSIYLTHTPDHYLGAAVRLVYVMPTEDVEIDDGTTILTQDYTQFEYFNYYVMENYIPAFSATEGLVSAPTYEDDGSVHWYQYFVADGIPTKKDKKYYLVVNIKGEEPGEFEVEFRWSWDEEPLRTTLAFGTEWETKELHFDAPIGGPQPTCVIFKPGDLPQTFYVRRLKVIYEGD